MALSPGPRAADDVAAASVAAAGDGTALVALSGPHQRALLVHCYLMLGSLDDADDAVQETLLKAWPGLPGFEGGSSMWTWMYRIATNVCLDAADRRRSRQVLPTAVSGPADPAAPPDDDQVDWLQPFRTSFWRPPTRIRRPIQRSRWCAESTSSWHSLPLSSSCGLGIARCCCSATYWAFPLPRPPA